MLNHTPTFGEAGGQNQSEAGGQNQTLLIFISIGVSHVHWYYSAQNKAYKVIVYLLKRK